MRISDWSSDVCSSDLHGAHRRVGLEGLAGLDHCSEHGGVEGVDLVRTVQSDVRDADVYGDVDAIAHPTSMPGGARRRRLGRRARRRARIRRSEEHASELQSLMRISYAVFCLKKKNKD